MSRALVHAAPGVLRLVEREVPEPADGDVLVRVRWCGICGSDLHVHRHGWRVRPGQVLGHEFTGEVLAAPGVAGVAAGDRVVVNPLLGCAGGDCPACRIGLEHLCQRRRGVLGLTLPGAFAETVLVPAARVGREVRHVPDDVPDRLAALHEPLAVGLHAVEVGRAGAGEDAVVFGAGTIGLATIHWLVATGVRTIAVDPVERRRESAAALGAVAVLPSADGLSELLPHAFAAGRADLVVDCAGAGAVIGQALSIVRPGGRVVLAAVMIGADAVPGTKVLDKEVDVRGAQAFTVAEHGRAVDALAAFTRAAGLVSHRFALEDAAAAFAVQGDSTASIKVLITPDPDLLKE